MGNCFTSVLLFFGYINDDAYTPPLTYDSYCLENDKKEELEKYQYQNKRRNYANNMSGFRMPDDDTSGFYNVHLR